MKLNVRSELAYVLAPGTEVILSIQAAASADQWIVSENLHIDPPASWTQDGPDTNGERRVRATLGGPVTIRYEASVDNGQRAPLPATALQADWNALPADVLPFLSPSRYCPSDRFVDFAKRNFGRSNGGARVHAILDWIFRNITYQAGVSTSDTDAQHTFNGKSGVCRDFAHLGITFCRALNIPARAVSVYALNLQPQDFHAVFEVYMDGGWWLVDATRMSQLDGLVRIGVGRDAADIAFLTTSIPCDAGAVTVSVEQAQQAAAA